MTVDNKNTKCGFVAVLGAPNAGKSTLINRLVGEKVSIVSRKVQTTRAPVRGIAVCGGTQMIFVDTPGLFIPKKRLERAMVSAAQHSGEEADAVLLLVDALVKNAAEKAIELLPVLPARKPVYLVLNKVDKARRADLPALAAALNEAYDFTATFMVSALKDDGLEDLMNAVESALPAGPWMYPPDQVSDMPMRLLAAEITREKLFDRLHQELPYNLTVETEDWEEFDNGDVKINQVVYVAREAHKKIALGKGGQTIKAVGQTARHELMNILETTVHLKLFVKVRENWAEDSAYYQSWGLDFSAG